MNKYGELKHQLEGLKHAIKQIEYGIENDSLPHIRAEFRYIQEKSQRVVDEMEFAISDNQ